MSRCLAGTGAAVTTTETRRKKAFGNLEASTGEAEWAATQTVHFAASMELEWSCDARAYTEHNVSSRHSHAMRFDIDRMYAYPTR